MPAIAVQRYRAIVIRRPEVDVNVPCRETSLYDLRVFHAELGFGEQLTIF
jgi:hypothetical protein